MIECEVKFSVRDLGDVKDRVIRLGGKHIVSVYEEDVFYQHPCRDFRASDEALRIRVTEDYIELTYKGPKISSRAKVREELTVRMDKHCFNAIAGILDRLGFKRVAVVRKRREMYRLDDYIICLDDVEGLGSFIEIEYSGEASVEEAVSKLMGMADMLGVEGKPIVKSYLELLLEKGKFG